MYEFEIKSSIFIEPNQIQTQILKFFAKKSANQWNIRNFPSWFQNMKEHQKLHKTRFDKNSTSRVLTILIKKAQFRSSFDFTYKIGITLWELRTLRWFFIFCEDSIF